MGKKVLVIGQGGREHALVWKLSQSPDIEKIYAAPGNPGISSLAECTNIAVTDITGLLEFAFYNKIDLTIVGPEVPLMEGIVDVFRSHGLKIFGPTAAAARLEGSKVFTKNLFKKYNIPTAEYEVFNEVDAALEYAKMVFNQGKIPVIKADGLAAGKGVVVAENQEEASEAIKKIMEDKAFGEAGDSIIIEECLRGEEVSLFVITDGKDYVSLLAAQDHKRIFDNDQGPNTGGMGAYTNPPIYDKILHETVIKTVIEPVIAAMEKEGCPYTGVLYAGLMVTDEGSKVLEFNARFGDPETQVLMPMIKSDLLPLLEATCEGKLKGCEVEIEDGACICVILAAGGYPDSYEKGKAICGINQLDSGTLVFHAGTIMDQGRLLTNGGRVLALVRKADNLQKAINDVYCEARKINFDNMHYRSDIGRKALR